jgi:hypothetical protein
VSSGKSSGGSSGVLFSDVFPPLPSALFLRDATSENISTTVDRGKALWRSIYAPHAEKLHDKLGSYHPDFICA